VDAALKLMESSDYDLMLIDKNMPGDDGSLEGGIELLKHVRSKSRHLRHHDDRKSNR